MNIQFKLIAGLLSVAALIAAMLLYGHRQYVLGVSHTTDKYEAALQKQKAEASELLSSETAKVLSITQALQIATQKQELQDARNKTTIDNLADRLRTAAGPAGRLRDPNAGCNSSGPASEVASAAGDRADHSPQAGGLLSKQLSGLLLKLTDEADEVNNAYIACRSDAYTVRN
jgi:hypothetical protein